MPSSPALSPVRRVLSRRWSRFSRRMSSPLLAVSKVGSWVAVALSVVSLIAVTLYIGYDHSPTGQSALIHILHICQVIFGINILFNLFFRFSATIRESRAIKWIVDVLLIISLVPVLTPHSFHSFIPFIESRWFLILVLTLYSIVDISYAVMLMAGRRTNPSLLLSSSFLLFILIGSLLLMLPRCNTSPLSYVDALFLSTSAVCITGLTPVDVSVQFTPMGLFVLALLIQIGGLGVMTFTCFFALFFTGNTSIFNQLMIKDMIYSRTFAALVPTLLYILGFTLVIEAIGAVAVYFSLPPDLPLHAPSDRILFSAFHSMSAFCNAGFSSLHGGLSNPSLLHSSGSVYLVTSALVLAGGIGFPTLVNFKSILGEKLRLFWCRISHSRRRPHRRAHPFDVNTRIVLVTTLSIFVLSALTFLILEWNNSLASFSVSGKIVQSIFNATVPRSSGFASVSPSSFLPATLLIMMILMWIGGASQSTAGGIKVNTLAASLLNLRSIITSRPQVTVFNRSISSASLRRASAVISISIFAYAFYAVTLVILQPDLPVRDLLFEAASALFTVGSSLGVTESLSDPSRILLASAMFLGRVGILSLLAGVTGSRRNPPLRLPSDNIIIN